MPSTSKLLAAYTTSAGQKQKDVMLSNPRLPIHLLEHGIRHPSLKLTLVKLTKNKVENSPFFLNIEVNRFNIFVEYVQHFFSACSNIWDSNVEIEYSKTGSSKCWRCGLLPRWYGHLLRRWRGHLLQPRRDKKAAVRSVADNGAAPRAPAARGRRNGALVELLMIEQPNQKCPTLWHWLLSRRSTPKPVCCLQGPSQTKPYLF